ncbi:MAG: SGNH/GDSL hydrolase family protein [Clostridia bacterium]|nr:SGNH/GDSL hydrolase family protein [Clostridia bacterium]
MKTDNLVINFLGDSITQGCGTSGPDKIFHAVLAKELGIKANNYGVSGTRIARQTTGCEDFLEYFQKRAERMDKNADVVVVFGGTNDFGHGTAPFGCFKSTTVDSFYGAMHNLCKYLIAEYAGKPIIFMTPLHRKNELDSRGDGSKPYGSHVLKDYVDVIKEVCEYYSLPVLDLYATSGIQPNHEVICEKFCPDGLHPNDEGHKIIAARLKGFLQSL